jgi:hypothetical protein
MRGARSAQAATNSVRSRAAVVRARKRSARGGALEHGAHRPPRTLLGAGWRCARNKTSSTVSERKLVIEPEMLRPYPHQRAEVAMRLWSANAALSRAAAGRV